LDNNNLQINGYTFLVKILNYKALNSATFENDWEHRRFKLGFILAKNSKNQST
jgi:hypothetical protein